MSGGRLVVLDRQGRHGKQFPLPSGLATLGSDVACDIRVLLPTICPHHATVVVHANQSVVRNVSDGETLVNGQPVSVAALAHGDVLSLGGRSLRWLYDRPDAVRALHTQPAVPRPAPRARPKAGRRRASAAAPAAARERGLQLELEMRHRASMPANAGGKQVAIVQPQRRDTNEHIEPSPRSAAGSPRSTASQRKGALQATTKASLWIESRKTPPLRLSVLRKAHSARKPVTKIQAPAKMDLTKQAAIMLMAGHTPRAKLSGSPQGGSGGRTPSLVLKKPSPLARPTPLGRESSSSRTPKRGATSVSPGASRRSSRRTVVGQSLSVLEITDTEVQNSSLRGSRISTVLKTSPLGSPLLPSPRKSALKDPSVKSVRKTESIKFDLSNLENHAEDDESEIVLVTDASANKTSAGDDMTLRFSNTLAPSSPSSRRSIHSRASRILEQVGSPIRESPVSQGKTLTPDSPQARKSLRGNFIVQKALEASSVTDIKNGSRYSRRTTKTISDQSFDKTVESAFKTRTLSPRASDQNNMESYSIVDLVSVDSNESTKSASVYDSVRSTRSSSIVFGTPQNGAGRKSRSTIEPTLLGSSTPYVRQTRVSSRSRSTPGPSSSKSSPNRLAKGSGSRRSQSLLTPESTQKHISINTTKILRASKSRSRISDSDLQLVSLATTDSEEKESPKSSRQSSKVNSSQNSTNVTIKSPRNDSFVRLSTRSNLRTSRRNLSSNNKRSSFRKNVTINPTLANSSQGEGTVTPENRNSPEEVGTPMLSIRSLLDSSQSSRSSYSSPKKARNSSTTKRKTTGAVLSGSKKTRSSVGRSKSFNVAIQKSLRTIRLRKESPNASKTDNCISQTDDEIVTPKSAVKLIQEAVKNKHSTAKKPKSKRSIIDTLNESDIVKQLFNSPVKRKLSQSMTEFSRKQLFDNDDAAARRPKRNTVALTGRTPNNSALDETGQITPEMFVSPLSTPGSSPNLRGVKLLFRVNTPNNDLRNVKGVKKLLRTPRTRKSVKNDLTNISGIKNIFARSPRNRLSDVRVKKVFEASPKNDLRRVSGVKTLFQSPKKTKQPKNDLSDVRGVRNLFTRRNAANDLRNVSAVKKTLQNTNSPKNDLTDVRGVRRMFRQEKQQADYSDLSGVEELFNESNASRRDAESLFDQLIGKPPIKAVYSKSFIKNHRPKPSRAKQTKSLHQSIDLITNNVEQWLEEELKKRVHKDDSIKSKVAKELQKLAIDTTEGNEPLRTTRVRNSTLQQSHIEALGRKKSASQIYSSHTLPIKKRSLLETPLELSAKLDKSNKLPIKKRAVVHSTPVKGRYNMTMNASELGRVSPIVAVDKTQNLENNRRQQVKESPKRKMQQVTELTNDVQEVNVEIYNVSSKSPKRGGNIGARKQANEVKETPKQTSKRVTKGKVTTEVEPATESRLTRGTRARLNTNKADYQSKTRPSPITKSRKGTKSSNMVNQSKREITQETQSRSSRRAKAENSVSVTQTGKGRKRKIDQVIIENRPVEAALTPKRTRNAQQQVPFAEKKSLKPKGTQAKTQENQALPKKTRQGNLTVESPVKGTRSRRNKTEDKTVSNTKKRRTSLVVGKKPPVMSPHAATSTRKAKKQISPITEKSKRVVSTLRTKSEIKLASQKAVKTTRAKLVVVTPSPKMNPHVKTRAHIQRPPKESPKKSQSRTTKRERRNTGKPKQNTSSNQSRGRSVVEQESKPDLPMKRGRRNADKSEQNTFPVQNKVRSKVEQESKPDPPKKRGRRTANKSILIDKKIRPLKYSKMYEKACCWSVNVYCIWTTMYVPQ
ncbi:proliferation marker protein Ki-67-like isoform X2 [Hyposmocoma kahamanoa]|uniref:proliferation marker protein Ki-67-like isoform X2 n=1 Tax=Hyposmocoma kahamanoa TaxID=1477025 RepID=UPI000E6D8D22|nr:proliferation marker protein Ki-67-like isoform X2 [Hyposmocoma kahamanoa]